MSTTVKDNLSKSGVTVPLKKSFLRYNVSALTATAADKSLALMLHYGFSISELVASPIGMILGSCISFFLGRNWTFISKDNKLSNQGLKFLVIALGNISLNWMLVKFFRDAMQLEFKISIFIAATIVGLCFSFPMQRFFVYK